MGEAERPLWGKQKGPYEGDRKALMREAERKNWMNDEHVVSLYIIVVAWS